MIISRLKTTACVCALSLSMASAEAALVSMDSGFGADTITHDTETGLNWLDLSVTTLTSWNDMQAMRQPGGTFADWRYATLEEIDTLFANAGIGFFEPTLQSVTDLMDLLGGPLFTSDNPDSGFHSVSVDGHTGIAGSTSDWHRTAGYLELKRKTTNAPTVAFAHSGNWGEVKDSFGSTSGHYLVEVSAVPVPAAVWLFGSGLLGLVGVSRRRQR